MITPAVHKFSFLVVETTKRNLETDRQTFPTASTLRDLNQFVSDDERRVAVVGAVI